MRIKILDTSRFDGLREVIINTLGKWKNPKSIVWCLCPFCDEADHIQHSFLLSCKTCLCDPELCDRAGKKGLIRDYKRAEHILTDEPTRVGDLPETQKDMIQGLESMLKEVDALIAANKVGVP